MDWFTADTHFGHANIIKYSNRPYVSVDEMDDSIIKNINTLVKPDDTLWHLGDFCFGPRDPYKFVQHAENYRNRINCNNIILIWGNHDPDPFSRKKEERIRVQGFRELFIEDYALRITTIMGQKISLCHYAMRMWDKSHHGAWHFYGHSHSGIEPWMDQVMPGRKSMDVGVDNITKILGEYRPISFQEIKKIMDSRPGFLEHHN